MTAWKRCGFQVSALNKLHMEVDADLYTFFFFLSPQFGNSTNITEHMIVAFNSAVRDGSDLLSMTELTCTAMECQFTYSI